MASDTMPAHFNSLKLSFEGLQWLSFLSVTSAVANGPRDDCSTRLTKI